MKGRIQNLSILIVAITILSISASTFKKSKLKQANETLTPATSRPLSTGAGSTIDVVGQARRSVDTDFIKINIQIVTLNSTANESMRRNNIISKELESIITSLDIDLKNITTSDFSLTPQYDSVNYTQVFKGYQTRNSLELTLSDLKLAEKVLGAISNVGNVEIQSINTGVSSQKVKETKDSLIDKAVADAQRIAGLTLRTMNSDVKSVQTISINEHISQISPIITRQFYGQMQAAAQMQAAPTLYKTKQDISVSVLIRFKIGPSIQ